MERRCAGGGAAARERRGAPGQNHDARIRLEGRDRQSAHRGHAQPVESGEDAWRILGRWRCRGRERNGCADDWDRWRRLDPDPLRVQWCVRPQADVRPGAGVAALAIRHGRSSRSDDAHGP